MKNELSPIGMIHPPYKELEGTPIQGVFAKGVKGTIKIFPEYREALIDLDGFSHMILLYHFHKSKGYRLSPTNDSCEHKKLQHHFKKNPFFNINRGDKPNAFI